MNLDELPPALALEVDALCDDYERHWHRARRQHQPAPDAETFLSKICAEARPALSVCLHDLERELRAGRILPSVPGFVLEEEIGRGGMGVVYRARQTSDGREVALKLIPGAEHARWSRWLRELVDLRHPNLVPLESFGVHDGLHYVVMPLIQGGDLKERLREFCVPGGEVESIRLMARVADAVGFLHRHGIVHRDLKPSNILLASRHDPEPLVCDFGLAGRLDETLLGTAGTPAYMAPEQRSGGPLTPAADIWSMGAILRELLADTVSEKSDLGRIFATCLRTNPADRFASADELGEALRDYLERME